MRHSGDAAAARQQVRPPPEVVHPVGDPGGVEDADGRLPQRRGGHDLLPPAEDETLVAPEDLACVCWASLRRGSENLARSPRWLVGPAPRSYVYVVGRMGSSRGLGSLRRATLDDQSLSTPQRPTRCAIWRTHDSRPPRIGRTLFAEGSPRAKVGPVGDARRDGS